MQGFDPANPDHIGTRTFDAGSHTVQKVCHVNHMGFFRRILNGSAAVRQSCSHHDIDRRSHADHIQKDMSSPELLRFRDDKAMFNLCLCTHGFETLQMLVNGTAPDVAASRKRHLRFFIFAKECTKKIIGGPDLLHTLALHDKVFHTRTIDRHSMTIHPVNSGADSLHSLQKCIDIPDIRKIVYIYCLICHSRSGKNCKSRILCTANFHVTVQRNSTLNYILFHDYTSSLCSDLFSM